MIIAQEGREDALRTFITLSRLSQIAKGLQHTAQIVDADRHVKMVRAEGRLVYSQRSLKALAHAAQFAEVSQRFAQIVDVYRSCS